MQPPCFETFQMFHATAACSSHRRPSVALQHPTLRCCDKPACPHPAAQSAQGPKYGAHSYRLPTYFAKVLIIGLVDAA
jgi:hypothetical protein